MSTAADNNKVKEAALEMIEYEIETLNHSIQLCSPVTKSIAVKYNLSGSLLNAIERLKSIRDTLKEQPACDILTAEINERNSRHDSFNENILHDAYNVEMLQALKAGDMRKYNTLEQRKHNRENKLHEEKKCICFTAPEI